jgi:hypothetical protein
VVICTLYVELADRTLQFHERRLELDQLKFHSNAGAICCPACDKLFTAS